MFLQKKELKMKELNSEWLNENGMHHLNKERTREEKIKILGTIRDVGKGLEGVPAIFDVPEIDENTDVDKMFEHWGLLLMGTGLRILEKEEKVAS
jgi:hypothetical protein